MAVVSSCREILGEVPQRAQPSPLVAIGSAGHSRGTAGDKPEEGGDDVKSSWPLWAWLHTCYTGGDNGQQGREAAPIPKSRIRSDWSLQLESTKEESQVIVGQNGTVNTLPGHIHTA